MGQRKLVLSVKNWGSEESIHTWKYLKAHVLHGKDGSWNDELVVVHVTRSKDKEKDKERWDQGGAVISSLQTALQPYKHDIFDLEGDPGSLIVDIANREQADILVLGTRGRNAMKKAVMGSVTDYIMQRANCACLVVKAQVGAGDTYRMKSIVQPQGGPAAVHVANSLQQRPHSPATSPMFISRLSNLPGSTPFNRRVAIAYDTTASGRFLLKWAAEKILKPSDNVFVVRAVPKMRKPGSSFADKNNVQRLAGDALQGISHVTTFNLQQGIARKSILSFVAKESVDLLIIGMYKPTTSRKGLALRGNAITMAHRCACPCLVVPMSEATLVSCVKATDLELAAAEEEELDSGSEPDSEDDEPGTPTTAAAGGAPAGLLLGAAADAEDKEQPAGPAAAQPAEQGGIAALPEHLNLHLNSFRSGASAIKQQIKAPIEAFFKRRGSTGHAGDGVGVGLSGTMEARRTGLLTALQGGCGNLPAGRYIVEISDHGVVRSIRLEKHQQQLGAQASNGINAAARSDPGILPEVAVAAATPANNTGAATDAMQRDGTGMADFQTADGHGSASDGEAVATPVATAVHPGHADSDASTGQPEQLEASKARVDVYRLQQALSEKEAEVFILRQQLEQAVSAQ